MSHAQRVVHSVRRLSHGGFEELSWELAIAEISAKLDGARELHSPRSFGLVGGGQAIHMDSPHRVTFPSRFGFVLFK